MVSPWIKAILKICFTISILTIKGASNHPEATGKQTVLRSSQNDRAESAGNCERTKRSLNTAQCTERPEGCFCEDRDDGCRSCNVNGCCMCDEFCLTANDCCPDFTLYCTKGCSEISCQNGGLCREQNNRFSRCECQNDFTGTFCEKNACKPFPSDIVIVIDISRSMEDVHIDKIIQFLKTMPDNMTIGHEQIQVALVTVSGDAELVHPFNSVVNQTDFHDKLTRLKVLKNQEPSEIVNGIDTAKELLTSRLHLPRNKFILILTDGLISTPSRLKYGYNPFYPVFTVAVGYDVSHYQVGIECSARPRTNCVCFESSRTDLIIAADASLSGTLDERTVLPEIFNKVFQHIEKVSQDTHLALVTFGNDIFWRFGFSKITQNNKQELKLKSYFIADSKSENSNLTNLFVNISSAFGDVAKGTKEDVQKVILILSRFNNIGEESVRDLANNLQRNGIYIYTIGNENSFDTMASITESAFNIGLLGNNVMDSIDSFLDIFLEHLSYIQCKTHL